MATIRYKLAISPQLIRYRLMLGRRIMLKASAEYQPDCRTDRCRAIAYAKAHTAVYAKGITKLVV
jgi:hypothetical protein